MKIAIGSDHRGYEYKNLIIKSCKTTTSKTGEILQIDFLDVGCYTQERCDYPIFAKKVAQAILQKQAEYGILICGSGVGMAITANRYKGIFAALAWNPEVARVSYEDDGINVIALPSDFITKETAIEIVKVITEAWAKKIFKGGRYQQRLEMIDRNDN